MKGGTSMCEHKRLKYVGKRGETKVFCADCGKELDNSFLMAENAPNQPAEEAPKPKAPAKKKPAKKAEKGE